MLRAVKVKAFIVFSMVHIGLAFSGYALWKMQEYSTSAQHQLFFRYFLIATVLMYGGFVTQGVFVYMPLKPWIAKARHVMNWRRWILDELPTLIALIPVVATIFHILRASWKEMKQLHKHGKLDLNKLSVIARKVVEQTEAHLNESKHGSKPHQHKSKRHSAKKKAA